MVLVALAVLGGCAVSSDIAIVPSDLPDARVGLDYDHVLAASGAEGETWWAVDGGELPPGLELAGDGTLSGVPTTSGLYRFTAVAMDDRGEATADLSVFVPWVVLLSGFGPFEGYPVNPSIEALRPLHQARLGDYDYRVAELEVTWEGSWEALEEEILRLDPVAVVATGVADTDAMRFEALARNQQYGTDIDGEQRYGSEVVEGGPSLLSTGLPTGEMAAAVEEAGYPVLQSNNAGTYLCNHVFYALMYHAESSPGLVAGFVHVPPAGDEGSSFTIADVTAAHEHGLAALLDWMSGGSAARRAHPDLSSAPTYRGRPARP